MFQNGEKAASNFANIILKKFCKHGTPGSGKESSLKVLKLSKNEFVLFVSISEMIDCYIHTSADVFQPSRVLFVKPSNCYVNSN